MNQAFSIRHELTNVLVNDRHVSGVLGDLLDEGAYCLQNDLVGRLGKLNQGGVRVSMLTGPEYMGVMRTLFNHRNDKDLAVGIESLRQILRQDFAKYWMMTGSDLFVPAKGPDFAVHGIDRAEPLKVFGNLTGDDGYLRDHHEEFVRVTLDATVDEVKEIYGNWINGGDTYVWRLSRKPVKGVVELALQLGRDGDEAYIASDGFVEGGVAREWFPKISTGNEGYVQRAK